MTIRGEMWWVELHDEGQVQGSVIVDSSKPIFDLYRRKNKGMVKVQHWEYEYETRRCKYVWRKRSTSKEKISPIRNHRLYCGTILYDVRFGVMGTLYS